MSPTDLKIRDACLRYAFYTQMIDDNASLMCIRGNYSDLCSERMAFLGQAEREILELSSLEEAPKELKRFASVATNRKGCSSCWLSSRAKKEHFECCVEIHRYFYEREIFRIWAESLLLSFVLVKRKEVSNRPYESLNEVCNNYKGRIPSLNYHRVEEGIVFCDKDSRVLVDKEMKLTTIGEVSEDILFLIQLAVPSLIRIFGEDK